VTLPTQDSVEAPLGMEKRFNVNGLPLSALPPEVRVSVTVIVEELTDDGAVKVKVKVAP